MTSWRQFALAGLATAAATAVSWWFDARMSVAGLAMVYLVAVAITGALLSRAAGVVASLLCVSALNYFFVPPRYSFEVRGAEYWWTLAVLLGVSLGLNALIADLRARRARAELGEARAAELHELAELLTQQADHRALASRAALWLSQRLERSVAVFVRDGVEDAQALECFAGLQHGTPFHAKSAQWAIEHGRMLGRGCADWSDLALWCGPFARRDASGAVQVLLPERTRPDAGTLAHWHALAQQVGLSVERRRSADIALAAQEQAHAEATRNTLLASLSHDLRTPLAGIVGSASALRTQGAEMSPAQQGVLLANMENEARDMTLMADNILQMARLSHGGWKLQAQWESVEEILGASVQRLRRRWEGARIQLSVPPGLPAVKVESGLVAQVIANLAENALRHAGVESVLVIQAGRGRDGIFIAVRDHGPGLPPGDPEALFDRYRQGEGASGRAGLGLAICKTIVQAHGGRIHARRCEPGAEFRIDLPAATEAEAALG